MLQDRTRVNILFSCTGQERKDYEPFVHDHAVSFILSGKMIISDGTETTEYKSGEIGFISKNQLVKTQKMPQENKPFMGISVFLSQEILYKYSQQHNIHPKGVYIGPMNFIFSPDPFLKGFFDSILPYFENPGALTESLATLKTIEIIELLIKKTQMKNILFNFQENFKIDLEAYMNKNFMHNIMLSDFAKLTGRSLSTFKRDFKEIFHETPSKWLIKKRLDLAYYLITKQNKKPVDVYYHVGFVNFSHFSRVFKANYGINLSEAGKMC